MGSILFAFGKRAKKKLLSSVFRISLGVVTMDGHVVN